MISIRAEKPEDLAAIHHVVHHAFGRAAEADLVDALRRNGKSVLSLVAEDNGRVIGHILFSLVTIESPVVFEDGTRHGVGLAPLAVWPERQNEGIGSMLVRQGLTECRNAGHPFAVVLGHPEYYPRFGFAPASRFGIKSEYDVRDEAFMALELQENALQRCAGLVKYQPEFGTV
jgi:putative acetyltransferase